MTQVQGKLQRDIQVAIVEDNRETRSMLASLLRQAPGFACVAECASAEEAMKAIPRLLPDVALVDLDLPGLSGADCIRALRAKLAAGPRQVAFMVLTVFENGEKIFEAIQAGASGYLTKRTPPGKILEAIAELHQGGGPMSPQIASRVLRSLQDAPGLPAPEPLSPREREILEHLGKGTRRAAIAEALGIDHGTVRKHLENIYRKLHVHSRAEALARVRRG